MGTSGLINLALFLIGIGAAIYFALYFFNTWRAKREQTAMRQDTDFKVWLDRVNAQLVQYGVDHSARALEDWKIDFDAGISPTQAAKNVRAGRAFTE